MRTIYKYPIEITDVNLVKIHVKNGGANPNFLHAGLDPQGVPCIWVEVDSDGWLLPCNVYVVGTGNPIPENAKHIGSFTQGPFVWHIYV